MANVIQILINAKNNASKAFKEAETDLTKMQKASVAVKSAIGAIAAGFAAQEIYDFAKEARAAGVELENARNKLTLAAGGADEYNATIKAATESTRGMVGEAKLANGAFVLLEMGLANNASEAAKLANAGNVLSKAFESQGASVELFNRLLANGSAVLLDNFGISQAQVNARQAEIQVTQGLSEQEARLAAIRELSIQKAENLASTMSDATIAAGQNQAAYDNMMSSLGELILATGDATPVMTGFFNDVTEAAKGWTVAVDLVGQLKNELAESSNINLDQEIGNINQSLTNITNPLGWILTTLPQLEPALTQLGVSFVKNTEAGKKLGEALVNIYGGSGDVAKGALSTVTPLSIEAEAALRTAQAYSELAKKQREVDANRARGQEGGLLGESQTSASLDRIRENRIQLSELTKQQNEEIDRSNTATAQNWASSYDSAASEIGNSVSQALNRLKEVSPEIAQQFKTEDPGEFARRLEALKGGLAGLDTDWAEAFKQQAGGNPLYAALLKSIEEGDSAGVAAEANRLMSDNLANVLATGLKESYEAKLREQNLLESAQKILAEQLGQQPTADAFNAATLAANDASVAQGQVQTGLNDVGVAAQEMGDKTSAAFKTTNDTALKLEETMKRILLLLTTAANEADRLNQQGVTAGNNYGVLPRTVGQTRQ